MSEPSAAEECGELAVAELAPARRYEPTVGTLVLILDENPVVEFDGPEGEAWQCFALATVKVEPSAIGRPVELMFVEGDLDRPVITKLAHVIDLQPELRPGQRYRLGALAGPRGDLAVLSSGLPLWLRRYLADEFVIRYGVQWAYEPDLFITRQREIIERVRARLDDPRLRFIDGVWYLQGRPTSVGLSSAW